MCRPTGIRVSLFGKHWPKTARENGPKSDFIQGFHSLERWKITHCTDKIWWGKWQRKGIRNFYLLFLSKTSKRWLKLAGHKCAFVYLRRDHWPLPSDRCHRYIRWVNELPHIFQLVPGIIDPHDIQHNFVVINDTHYNPCYFHFCTTLVRWKCYFILQKLTKLQSSEVFREIPTLAQDWAQRSPKTSMQYSLKRWITRCGGLAKMPDIHSAEIPRFRTNSRNTGCSQNACFDPDTEPKFCLWIQIISLI